jgi:hypothetical protein
MFKINDKKFFAKIVCNPYFNGRSDYNVTITLNRILFNIAKKLNLKPLLLRISRKDD